MMRTRNLLLLSRVVCCLYLVQFINCQEDQGLQRKIIHQQSKIANKYDDKTSKGKYNHPDFVERTGIYRNNRAIDVSGGASYEGNSGKSGHQSPSPTNLPKQNTKPRKPIKSVMIGDGICKSLDIRNSIKNLEYLRECRVIEGFLQIVLIEGQADFQNISFPKLREITDYFLLYRVANLKTLSELFPNLEVIRGDTLLADYAFAVYEMQKLQEIGLNKLIEISRGAVRIEKNPSLCYTSTLDWNAIVVAGENVIKDNKVTACPVCSHCPNGHCWNAKYCQKTERPKCHHQCLGECFGSTEFDCYICKNYRHEDRCIESCPSDLYAYLSRRCITKMECENMNQMNEKTDTKRIWRPFKGSCITRCPDGYEDAIEKNNTATCRACKGLCPKIVQGAIVRHISDAQIFRGTAIVRGALELQIRNGHPNIITELTDAFGMIEEITEYLKITHSFPITTLSFFKKLRVIKGEKLDTNNASMVVLDNPNLSNLFADGQQIEIQNGRLFFHYNPKLCLSKIIHLGNMTGITNLSYLEVQRESNGEKVACDIVDIKINVENVSPNNATLIWDAYEPSNGQRLLSYLLNYIETDNDNVTYESTACGNKTWQIKDVEIPRKRKFAKNFSTVSQILVNLKPYTKYAVYVKTLSARERDSHILRSSFLSPTGQSEIIYFRTLPDVPTVPTDVESFAASDSEIIVKWSPPKHPNGPIAYYMLTGFIRLEDEKFLAARNYCKYGLVAETDTDITQTSESPGAVARATAVAVAIIPPENEDHSSPSSPSCCTKNQKLPEVTEKPKFEIFCHENMTISYLSSGNKNYCYSHKYDVEDRDFYDMTDNLSSSRASVKEETSQVNDTRLTIDDRKTRIYNGTYYSFVFNVSVNSTSYLLKKLRHSSLYTISVGACGHQRANFTQMCSSTEYTHARTKNRPDADIVRNVEARVTNDTIVTLTWTSPRDSNGPVVSFTIEYTNLMVKDSTKSTDCVTRADYISKRERHYMKNLSPGKYGVRVRATTVAGDGPFSQPVEFSIGIKEDDTIFIVVTPIFIFITCVAIGVYLVFRNNRKKQQQARLIASVNPDYIETKYVRDHWEVPRENIEILEELGLGNFGMVYRGILEGTTGVAIKTISDTCGEREKNEFLNEASVMKNFSTFHIIRLLGVVSEGVPPYVIMELMENGDLKTYLRKIRETNLVPDVSRMIRMAGEIADGMAYLESKKFIHRDLAARNCMISKELVCKIGDFGMARDIYETDYYKIGKKGLLPIRWMAPENLSDGVFTSDSDVWSFGVVLYEILTLAEIPYQGFSNEEVLNYVLRKGTVTIPPNSPENIVKIMNKCFKWRPSDRPTFMEIVAELEPFLSQDFCDKSFYHSEEGVEIRNLGLKKVYHHAAPIRFHWGNETARWVREFEDNATLLDQTKAGTSRGRIFQNGFQHFGNVATLEDVPLDI